MSEDVAPTGGTAPASGTGEPPPTVTWTTDDGATVHGEQTERLTERSRALGAALVLGGDRIDPVVAARVQRTLSGVGQRLALGVDHTVVALVGGTGSGKSSLFNAISGLDFSEVGARRPTTAQVSACVWGRDGGPLLDWLGVDPDRRIERESLLDGETEAPLRGLVLLDLPDHDSIEAGHREVVDRLLPMADLLVWVVDPQKYADDALHTDYLRRLVGHEGAMVVVLNQIDTVPADVHDALAADVAHLLEQDGLTGVPVHVASARTGEGVAEMRDVLASAVAGRSSAARRAAAEVNDAATALAGQVGPREHGASALTVGRSVDTLAQAAGLAAVGDAVGATVRGGGSDRVPALGDVRGDLVASARRHWLEEATVDLPARWVDAVAARLATTEDLRERARVALAGVTVAARPSRLAAWLVAVGLLLALAGVVGVSMGAGALLGGGVDGIDEVPATLWVGIACAVLAVVAFVAARAARRAAGRRAAVRVVRRGREALESVARAGLAEPTTAVLAEHRQARELVATARRA